MKIVIGNDHAAVSMKQHISGYLESLGHHVINVGVDKEDSVDYPDYAKEVAMRINNDVDFGILICGTGIGMSIAANKFKGIRAALVYDVNTAQLAKAHNNANIITLGARTQTLESAMNIIKAYMDTSFEERHQTRIDKITMSEV